MAVVFGAIVPHSPILAPTIGKNNTSKLKKTLKSLQRLEADLYAARPDTLILFSAHGTVLPDAFNMNLSSDYIGTFEEFGDFSTQVKATSDIMSAQAIRSFEEIGQHTKLVLTSSQKIDYGISLPLTFLASHLPQLKIIPICPSGQSLAEHYEFGRFLKRSLLRIDKRFAVIASGDMSHRLAKNSPGGYSKNALPFDKKIVKLLEQHDTAALLDISTTEMTDAAECSLKVMCMLLGTVHEVDCQIEVLSYEHPFGVGCLTAQLQLP